jgi:hypothetical protein
MARVPQSSQWRIGRIIQNCNAGILLAQSGFQSLADRGNVFQNAAGDGHWRSLKSFR